MIKDLKDLEEKSNMEFRVKNAAARDRKAATKKAEDDKAEAKTIQLLEANFPKTGSGTDGDKVLAIPANTHFELASCARRLGLAYNYFYPYHIESWEIVGRRPSSVEKKTSELRSKDNERLQEYERKRKGEAAVKREADEETYLNKPQKFMDHAVKNKSEHWDVAGT
jgi:hypothetical protein